MSTDLRSFAEGASDNQGFGASNLQDLAELQKALLAGSGTGNDALGSTTASGQPLKVESLDSTLKHLEFNESDIVMWRTITRTPAYNTVEEFNQLVSYGIDRGGFTSEGELPEEEDTIYRRAAEHVKFLGVVKSVSHPMQLVRIQPGIGDIVQREVKNGTMWILRKADRAIVYGDAATVPEEFNGLYKQQRNSYDSYNAYMTSTSVVDLRGASLKEADLGTASTTIVNNNGYGDLLVGPPSVIDGFNKQFLGMKLFSPNSPEVSAAVVGQKTDSAYTQFGRIDLKYDKFLTKGKVKTLSSGAESPKSPNAPTAGGAPAAVIADSGFSKFATGDAGTYYFAVTATNRYGESALLSLNASALAVAANESVDLQWVNAGGAYPATAYTVYRTTKNPVGAASAQNFFPLFTVSVSEVAAGFDGAAVTKVRDRNRWLPNTQEAFLIENSSEIYEFKQLAPLMKMDLAVISPATRFMVLMYGTPQLFAPLKMVRFINIGPFTA